MLSPFAAAVGFAVRVAAFFLALGLLPKRIVPCFVHSALALATFLFLIPTALGMSFESGFSFTLFVRGERQIPLLISALPYKVLVLEVATGLLLAVSVSLAMYAAELFSGYLSTLMLSRGEDDSVSIDRSDASQSHHVIKAALSLLLLYVLFHQVGFAKVLEYFGRSSFVKPFFVPEALDQFAVTSCFQSIAVIGSQAFALSALLAAPFFVASLVFDFLFLLQRRYFSLSFLPLSVQASRIMLLVLLLSVNVYYYTNYLRGVLDDSTSERAAERLFSQVKN